MGISPEDDDTVLSDEEWIDMQDHDGDDLLVDSGQWYCNAFHLVW